MPVEIAYFHRWEFAVIKKMADVDFTTMLCEPELVMITARTVFFAYINLGINNIYLTNFMVLMLCLFRYLRYNVFCSLRIMVKSTSRHLFYYRQLGLNLLKIYSLWDSNMTNITSINDLNMHNYYYYIYINSQSRFFLVFYWSRAYHVRVTKLGCLPRNSARGR